MSILARSTPLTFTEVAGLHTSKEIKILRDRPISVGALDTRVAVAATLLGDGLAVLVVDVGEAVLDEHFGPASKLSEVVAGEKRFTIERVTEPRQIFDDAVNEARVFGLGVGVVEAQVADAGELTGQLKVGSDRLGVANVQVAVRLGRETGHDPAAEGALRGVFGREVVDEVGSHRACVARRSGCGIVRNLRVGHCDKYGERSPDSRGEMPDALEQQHECDGYQWRNSRPR